MKGIDTITSAIRQDAEAEIASLREQTQARCDEIREDYNRQAQETYLNLVRQGMKDCESRVQRMGSAAEMEAKKAVLAMKQQMVSQAFERAVEKVCTLPEKDYVDFLARQAAQAAVWGQEELVFNERDRAAVGKKVAKAANALLAEQGKPAMLTVSELTREIRGGLFLKQGNIETNCSVESIASSLRSEMASEVASAMFG